MTLGEALSQAASVDFQTLPLRKGEKLLISYSFRQARNLALLARGLLAISASEG